MIILSMNILSMKKGSLGHPRRFRSIYFKKLREHSAKIRGSSKNVSAVSLKGPEWNKGMNLPYNVKLR